MDAVEEIANDTSRSWDERIRASAELQYREAIKFKKGANQMKGCKMPGCQRFASKHWALVDVCYHCFDNLQAESQKYYAKRIKPNERILYKQIQAIRGKAI